MIIREESLDEPLPQYKIGDIEIFDEFVDADKHLHDWKCVSSQLSITSWGCYNLVFECKSCGDMVRRLYRERLF